MDEKLKRRWYQFRLRTMLIVVTLLCGVFAWVGYSLNWIRERREAFGKGNFCSCTVSEYAVYAPSGLWLFDEPGYVRITVIDGDSKWLPISEVRRLFPEAEISDVGVHMSD
jgi:hypothetical protein